MRYIAIVVYYNSCPCVHTAIPDNNYGCISRDGKATENIN